MARTVIISRIISKGTHTLITAFPSLKLAKPESILNIKLYI